tara:strand:- start:1104 stop:1844 length:741 start_codon:yes stop_codon:yes gene_type:complete
MIIKEFKTLNEGTKRVPNKWKYDELPKNDHGELDLTINYGDQWTIGPGNDDPYIYGDIITDVPSSLQNLQEMKITRRQLRQIIKEELLNEGVGEDGLVGVRGRKLTRNSTNSDKAIATMAKNAVEKMISAVHVKTHFEWDANSGWLDIWFPQQEPVKMRAICNGNWVDRLVSMLEGQVDGEIIVQRRGSRNDGSGSGPLCTGSSGWQHGGRAANEFHAEGLYNSPHLVADKDNMAIYVGIQFNDPE